MRSFASLFCIGIAVFLVGVCDATDDDNGDEISLPGFCDGLHPPACPRNMRPQCVTSINRNFNNLCLLCDAILKGELAADVTYQSGRCPLPLDCDGFSPTAACTFQYDPKCASNKVTYSNLCDMCSAVARGELAADATYEPGRCPEPLPEYCGDQAEPTVCLANIDYKCASNDVTYSNLCELCNAIRRGDLAADATFVSGQCAAPVTPVA